MKIRVNDIVKIMTGKDNGKTGKVIKLFKKTDRVLVEGMNKVKKHLKPGAVSKEGGIVEIERPIHISNVMYFDAKANKASRVGSKIVDGKKYRLIKETGEAVLSNK